MSQKIVTNLLRYAAKSGARRLDIDIQPGKISLDSRQEGGNSWTITLPARLEKTLVSSLRHLIKLAPDELASRKYTKIVSKGNRLDCHISVKPQAKGERIIIDFLDNHLKLWRLNQLGLSAPDLKKVHTFLRRRSGLMIVSSPPRQGRSSTLSALLLEINNTQKNICWLCGPYGLPPFSLPGVNYLDYRQTNWEKISQHDSDLIMADDISDLKNLQQALRTASTGRLVIIALKADNERQLLNLIETAVQDKKHNQDALKLIIHQTLIQWPIHSSSNPRQRQRLGRFKILAS